MPYIDVNGKRYATISEIINVISSGNFEGRNFADNCPGIFLLTNISKRYAKSGKTYLSCIVRDKTSSMNSKIWEWKEAIPESGCIVVADYSYNPDFGLALDYVKRSLPISEAFKRENLKTLLDELVPKADVEYLKAELYRIIDSVSNEDLKKLLNMVFKRDEEFSELFFKSPAASLNHHVKIGGLLEHSVRIAQLCDTVASFFKDLVDRDLLISGALLHDIGKAYSYSYEDLSFDMTNRGLLEDHIIIGIKLLTKAVLKLEGFPENLEELLTHILASHHGFKEWGSPVIPKTLEAIIIHNLDRLEAQADSFIEAMKNTPDNQDWTEYIPMLGGSVFLNRKTEESEE